VALLALGGLTATSVLPASAQTVPEAAAAPPRYPASGQVTVRAGETLYSIARRTLGDGSRYVEIFEINRGRPQRDGATLSDPGVLHVGWRLELPLQAGPAPAPPPPAPGGPDRPGPGGTYTVRTGDSLSGIARSQLGDATRYDEIFDLNRGRPQAVGGSLTDPARLTVGWVLELPGASGGGDRPVPSRRRHTVAVGDSLSSIAEDLLGDAERYPEIFELNEGRRQAVGGTLTDPSVLRVGWVLRLPRR
jgi:nucleoid-associated protein YgaU